MPWQLENVSDRIFLGRKLEGIGIRDKWNGNGMLPMSHLEAFSKVLTYFLYGHKVYSVGSEKGREEP